MKKAQYKVRNWKDYNKALVKRGSLTLWIDEECIKSWNIADNNFGRPRLFSDAAIECCVALMSLYNLTLRMCEGFINSIFNLMHIELKSPSYTQICRRMQKLNIKLNYKINGPIHMVVDSTGLKMYGEGEWKVRMHGYSKHRVWRKLHIGVDERTNEIVAAELTTNSIADNKILGNILNAYHDKIIRVSADKGYDGHKCFELIVDKGADPAILTQNDSKINKNNLRIRDLVLKEIEEIGREEWKKKHNYHRRSLAETAMFRLKTIFGPKLKTREFERQKVEALMKCNILNIFNSFCALDSYTVT